MDISINFSNTTDSDVTKLPLLFSLRCRQGLGTKAKINMREELRSSSQPAWLRRILRSRACLQTAPCSSSHLDFLKL